MCEETKETDDEVVHVVIGPFFYTADQAPTYALGVWSMIVAHLVEICVVLVFWTLMRSENRRRDRVQGGRPDPTDLDATAFADLTDRENLNFRYIY